MLDSVYIIGTYTTTFGKWPEKSGKELTRDALVGVLEDAGMSDAGAMESSYFSNCGMGILWDQDLLRGHCMFAPMVDEGLFPERVPLVNVEGGCASGSIALHLAWKDILSGLHDVSLAIGMDKFYHEDMARVMTAFNHGIDREEKDSFIKRYQQVAQECGQDFRFGPERSIFMDTYAMQACWHMWKWGTTQEQIAIGASKNHHNGSLNPKAQYRFEVPVDKVLSDYLVSYPMTRSMCAPIGDGAAAAILCSEKFLKQQPAAVRDRAVKIRASVLSGGKNRPIAEPSLTKWAADKAYNMSGLAPKDIDVAEVHDATSFCEIYQAEMMGFCPIGKGGEFIASGATMLDGEIPINTSGGLVSKGHPIGATGLSMVYEVANQLRGEAQERQVKDAGIGLIENGGGVISVEEFACGVTILERN
ncbi:thiolase family protein [Desulforhopalus singaporensis]|uniref:propanoyl-CoA C-acyltransferase n=1 Tax=Desulforhopalus singaporensis TaxID=91360 RepID=A0A1H0UEU1_9BACT|nr:thiolase family protein [Desulforhopalus singaporensis]SDP64792.1 Acetyl-CoA acetyltransferase [Desulforhopalus singaporensis]